MFLGAAKSLLARRRLASAVEMLWRVQQQHHNLCVHQYVLFFQSKLICTNSIPLNASKYMVTRTRFSQRMVHET
jgi:hypothetical protein